MKNKLKDNLAIKIISVCAAIVLWFYIQMVQNPEIDYTFKNMRVSVMNSSLLGIKGGLIIVVADDPSMHSSQGEQDSRFYADYAMIPCFEPTTQQEAYEMVFDAFAISERLGIDKSIIDRAGELVSSENTRFEDVVDLLEKSRLEMEDEHSKARAIAESARADKEKAEKIKDLKRN